MNYKGSSAYDQEDFFKNFMNRRNRKDSPNKILEEPVFQQMMGDITKKHILDLGCGDAQYGKELLERNCASFEGVEGSYNMVNAAKKNLSSTNSMIHYSSMESWPFPENKYDIVCSRLVMHYIQDIHAVFHKIDQSLKTNGKFIFSVQHPVLTSSVQSASQSGKRTNWIVDDYFHITQREEPWIGQTVVKYHRTFEEYFKVLKINGFQVEDVSECMPQRELFDTQEEYERRLRIPVILIFSCKKIN